MIIGFCNKKFYGGALIPYTSGGAERPMIVVRTVQGNHMRQHRGGGRSNQREIDVIVEEVIRDHCQGFAGDDIGVTTAYREQADRAADVLDEVEVDTIHKFQGRQKQVVILTTVLDDTPRGRTGLPFADDPQKVNVAVSRAIQRFIVVTSYHMLPGSRHIRDLVGYIRYHNPGEEVVDSTVISVFDLLYREHSQRLQPLAARLRREQRYPTEDIIWTVLHDIIAEPAYEHLTVVAQVLLKSLLPGLSRLTSAQLDYVKHHACVDFVVYNSSRRGTLSRTRSCMIIRCRRSGCRRPAAASPGEFGRRWTRRKPTGLGCQPDDRLRSWRGGATVRSKYRV